MISIFYQTLTQHFTSSGGKTGSTQLRDFLLEQRGWRVVSLPYFAINAASTDAELTEYLAGALLHNKPQRSSRLCDCDSPHL